MTERNGNWFQTYTGKKFYVLDPRPEDICIEDIAHSLSLLCRFNGHIQSFYSVAQHSIHVCNLFGKLVAGTDLDKKGFYLCALLHDAAEAYIGDVIRPVKYSIPQIKEVENNIERCVFECFDLQDHWPKVKDIVKQADRVMLITERRDLLLDGPGKDKLEWKIDEQVEPDSNLHIVARNAPNSEAWFRDLFNGLQ